MTKQELIALIKVLIVIIFGLLYLLIRGLYHFKSIFSILSTSKMLLPNAVVSAYSPKTTCSLPFCFIIIMLIYAIYLFIQLELDENRALEKKYHYAY